MLELKLLLLLVSKRRARFAFGLETDAALARLVVDAFAAELLRVTTIAGLANYILGHGHDQQLGDEQGGEDMEKV